MTGEKRIIGQLCGAPCGTHAREECGELIPCRAHDRPDATLFRAEGTIREETHAERVARYERAYDNAKRATQRAVEREQRACRELARAKVCP